MERGKLCICFETFFQVYLPVQPNFPVDLGQGDVFDARLVDDFHREVEVPIACSRPYAVTLCEAALKNYRFLFFLSL